MTRKGKKGKGKTNRISRRAFAREKGASASTVDRMAHDGRLPKNPDGSLKREEAEEAWKEIEAERAQDHERRTSSSAEVAVLEEKLLIAKLREREAISRLREIELERESGRYVALELVQRDAKDTRERILGVLRSVPQRVARALECPCQRAAVVEAKVSDEVERAIAELAESKFAEVGEVQRFTPMAACALLASLGWLFWKM